MRVRLYDVDSSYWGCEEKDLCRAHLDVVAGAYPDNIETIVEYVEPPAERIYVASSWRNIYQEVMVATCRSAGFEVYDFKDSEGFSWKDVDPAWGHWDYEGWQKGLRHDRAEQGFKRDMDALEAADRCILVLPSGRSAHLETGYAIGKGKPTAIWVPEYDTPDLMVKMADLVTDNLLDILGWLGVED